MRLTLLTIFAMTIATLGAAIFFVHATDAQVPLGGPLLGKYAASWRTAQLVERQPDTAFSPLTNVTIINATR